MNLKTIAAAFLLILLGITKVHAQGWARGIYITQPTLENTRRINYLIKRAKAVKINTFVVDIYRKSKRYQQNIRLVEDNGIRYVARLVVFPNGGKPSQVKSKKYWVKKYRLAEYAIKNGASAIQLDYIRYYTGYRPSSKNAHDINEVIKYFKQGVSKYDVPLQIDVFGVAAEKPSTSIGQDLRLFAPNIDAVNPMVYPSHYYPYTYHSQRPYETIRDSLDALAQQFDGRPPFRIYAFIEANNHRYPMNRQQKIRYIYDQIRAVEDSNVNGWYVWSPRNHYNNLFRALERYPVK